MQHPVQLQAGGGVGVCWGGGRPPVNPKQFEYGTDFGTI